MSHAQLERFHCTTSSVSTRFIAKDSKVFEWQKTGGQVNIQNVVFFERPG